MVFTIQPGRLRQSVISITIFIFVLHWQGCLARNNYQSKCHCLIVKDWCIIHTRHTKYFFPNPSLSSLNFYNCHSWLVLYSSFPFGQTHWSTKQFLHLHAWSDIHSHTPRTRQTSLSSIHTRAQAFHNDSNHGRNQAWRIAPCTRKWPYSSSSEDFSYSTPLYIVYMIINQYIDIVLCENTSIVCIVCIVCFYDDKAIDKESLLCHLNGPSYLNPT